MKISHYDKKYFLERDLLLLSIAQTVEIFAKDHKLRRILDVGCGTGRLVKYLNKHHFFAKGADNSQIAVLTGNRLNKKRVIFKASATKLPFKDNTFDLVLAISLIEHLELSEAKKFIQEANRVLKPNGFIFLVTPNFITPIRLIQGKNWFGYSDPTHINFFTPKSLSKLLSKNDFGNFKFTFKFKYDNSFAWEFPGFFSKLPYFLRVFLVFLFFATPITFLRNSFWMAGQKNDN